MLALDGEGPVGEQVYRAWKTLPDAARRALETKQEEDLQNAASLLRGCRRLGAPGEVEAAKTPAGRRRSGA